MRMSFYRALCKALPQVPLETLSLADRIRIRIAGAREWMYDPEAKEWVNVLNLMAREVCEAMPAEVRTKAGVAAALPVSFWVGEFDWNAVWEWFVQNIGPILVELLKMLIGLL